MNQSFNGEGMTPELLLECARKAYQNEEWDATEEGTIYQKRSCLVFSIHNANDQMALQIKLEDDGWVFYRLDDLFGASKGAFSTFFDEVQLSDTVHAPTKPELLAKCVQATVETMEGGEK